MANTPSAAASKPGLSSGVKGLLRAVGQSLRAFGQVAAQVYYRIVLALAKPFIWLAQRLEAVEQRILDRAPPGSGRWRRLGTWFLRLPVRLPRWLLQKIVIGIVDGPAWLASVALVLGGLFIFVFMPISYSEWVGAA